MLGQQDGVQMSDTVCVKWSFPLHPDLESLVAEKNQCLPRKRPGLINRTEVVGYLTENRCGVIIDPDKDPVMGYYLVDALSMIGLDHFGESEEWLDLLWSRYSRLLTLIYMDSTTENPEIIGVLDPSKWKEECLSGDTVALTYRIPAPHGEEYREETTRHGVSQVDAIADVIWQKIRDWRFEDLISRLPNYVVLGNGEVWEPETSVKYLPIPEHSEV